MDGVAGLLDGPRARGGVPAALDHGPAVVAADPRRGAADRDGGGARQRLGAARRRRAGRAAAPATSRSSRGPGPYTVADDPATAPQVVIHPGQVCETLGGEASRRADGPRRAHLGQQRRRRDRDAVGTYQLDGEVSRRLLRALPPLVVLRAGEWSCPVIPLLADEIVKDEPGQEAVLDRLLDLLLIAVLRAWFARPEAEAPGWYRAHGDPVVGHALRMLHHNPAHPWTVASLAREIGVSRAALARRFNDLVGEPPMTFLTELADRARRRPAARAGRDDRLRRRPGRLRQPVRAQHRVQAGARRVAARAPRGGPRRVALSRAAGSPRRPRSRAMSICAFCSLPA